MFYSKYAKHAECVSRAVYDQTQHERDKYAAYAFQLEQIQDELKEQHREEMRALLEELYELLDAYDEITQRYNHIVETCQTVLATLRKVANGQDCAAKVMECAEILAQAIGEERRLS